MSRRRRQKRTGPVGGGGARHPNSLGNLKRGENPPRDGHLPALRHGGYARVAAERLDEKAREVFDALAADAPMQDTGGLPAADAALVRLAAEVLCRLDDVGANVRDFGLFDQETGAIRPVVELESRLRREAADHLDALGMSPRSRARLGVDVARAQHFDLARHWADEDGDEGGGADGPDTVDGDAEAAA